ncbi:MAG TPA: hypothetical protein VF322_12710 [Gammaproteobacteria bacterium]
MQDFLATIEGSGIATWVRESPSIFAYTTVLSLHAMGLAVVVGTSTVIALRLLGFARGIPIGQLLKLYPIMWIGFTVNAISGLLLLAANASGMLANSAFIVKMGLILVAMIVMELMRHRITADAAYDNPGSAAASAPTRALGVAAMIVWAGVIIAGRLTAYPNFLSSLLGLG